MSFAAQIHPAEASTLFFKCVTSLVAQMVKRLPTVKETWIQPLGWEDLLEKEMTTHSSILAWKIPWMEEPGRLQSMGLQSGTRLSNFTSMPSANIMELGPY